MRKSRFTREEKLQILQEREKLNISIEQICVNHNISQPTYYNWKRELSSMLETLKSPDESGNLQTENKNLRNLYIDLSEHTYKLAKFLSK